MLDGLELAALGESGNSPEGLGEISGDGLQQCSVGPSLLFCITMKGPGAALSVRAQEVCEAGVSFPRFEVGCVMDVVSAAVSVLSPLTLF